MPAVRQLKTLQMQIILIKVIESDKDGNVIRSLKKKFEGKESDKDSIKFLQDIHDAKMNKAAEAAGLGKFSAGKIVKPSSHVGMHYPKPKYADLEKQISSSIRVEIETL